MAGGLWGKTSGCPGHFPAQLSLGTVGATGCLSLAGVGIRCRNHPWVPGSAWPAESSQVAALTLFFISTFFGVSSWGRSRASACRWAAWSWGAGLSRKVSWSLSSEAYLRPHWSLACSSGPPRRLQEVENLFSCFLSSDINSPTDSGSAWTSCVCTEQPPASSSG